MADRSAYEREAHEYISNIVEKRRAITEIKKLLLEAEKEEADAVRDLRVFSRTALLGGVDLTQLVTPYLTDESARKKIAHGKGKKPPEQDSSPGRGISDKWKRIIGAMVAGYPEYYSAADVQRLAAKSGIAVKPNTSRSQLLAYFGGGYLERDKDGRYRATPIAAREVNVPLGGQGPAPSITPTE